MCSTISIFSPPLINCWNTVVCLGCVATVVQISIFNLFFLQCRQCVGEATPPRNNFLFPDFYFFFSMSWGTPWSLDARSQNATFYYLKIQNARREVP